MRASKCEGGHTRNTYASCEDKRSTRRAVRSAHRVATSRPAVVANHSDRRGRRRGAGPTVSILLITVGDIDPGASRSWVASNNQMHTQHVISRVRELSGRREGCRTGVD